MKEGSPLKVLTENFRQSLKPLVDFPLAVAMRYANPTPEKALQELESQNPNLEEVLIAPMYPLICFLSGNILIPCPKK